jgi:hypothetical protein
MLPSQVEDCILEVRYEVSPALRALREVIRSKVADTDLTQTAQLFNLPLPVLNVVVGRDQQLLDLPRLSTQPAPVKPKKQAATLPERPRRQAATYPDKPTPQTETQPEKPKPQATTQPEKPKPQAVTQHEKPRPQAATQPEKPKPQSATQPEKPKPQAPTQPEKRKPVIKAASTQAADSHKAIIIDDDPPSIAPSAESSSETEALQAIQKHINELYNRGVKASILSGLYKLPTPLIHTWGNWTQLPAAKAEENRSLSNSAKDLLASGVSEHDVKEAIGIRSTKAYSNLLGRCELPKAFSSDRKRTSVNYVKLIRNAKKVSEELQIPIKRLRRWVNKTDLSSDDELLEFGWGKRRDEERLASIGEYYANKKKVTAVARKLGADAFKVIGWVTEFERSTTNKRHKALEGEE